MAEQFQNERVLRCEVREFIAEELVALRFESARSPGPLWSLSLDLAERVVADLQRAIERVRNENERLRRTPS